MRPKGAPRRIQIGDHWIGDGEPCYIVAELSGNHNQSFERAVALVEAAKAAGADAIKLQTYTADTLTIDGQQPWFRVQSGNAWAGKTLHDLYSEAYTPWEWHPKLQRIAHGLGMDCFSTPFDPTAVEFLERLNMPVYKVASFELVDIPLLRHIGNTRKPVIASTGMANLGEIDEAVATLREAGCQDIVLLKCTSAYPAPPAEMNLRTIPHLAAAFDVIVGLSDHTLGSSVAIAAVALGAAVVEKHLTISRADGGPDSGFSMEPHEFRDMVDGIRQAEQALGRVSYERTADEQSSAAFRRSLFVVRDVARGEVLNAENVRSIRPANGLHPRFLPQVIGRVAAEDLPRGTPLNWTHLA